MSDEAIEEPQRAIDNWRAARATDTLLRLFSDPDHPDGDDFDPIEVPAHWQTQPGLEDFDGTLLYRADVTVPTLQPGQRRWLRFNGICYTGDVFLDGVYVGATSGYFTHHRFEVTDLLSKSGTSLLGVEVGAPRHVEGEPRRALTGWFAEPPGVDPSWNPGGIWQPVSIIDTGPVAIRHFRALCLEADEHRAVIGLRAVLFATEPDDVTVTTTVADTTHDATMHVAAGENQIEWTMEVLAPDLWWPHGLGDQPMHDLRVTAQTSDGVISDRKHRRIGLRSTTMRDFILRVNRHRVFARGINVAPTEGNLAQLPPEGFRTELEAIRDSGFNAVRVRSHVSRLEFYDACDDLGILVWQDLPLNGKFDRGAIEDVEVQAREMVDLLAHHPSIVVWGGHMRPHTDDVRSTAAPSITSVQIPTWNRSVLDRAVRRVLNRSDPTREVVASSDVPPHVPDLSGTDIGLYFGWFDGEAGDLADYAAALPRFVRFVSDFGAQALPSRVETDLVDLLHVRGAEPDTLRARIPAADHDDVREWIERQRDYQADVLKTTIEILRLLKYQPTGGFFAGLWKGAGPGLSRALVDHDRTPRPALEAARNALQPVLPVLYPPRPAIHARTTTRLAVHVVNDLPIDVELRLEAEVLDGHGLTRRSWEGTALADEVVFIDDLEIRGGRIGDIAEVTLRVEGNDLSATNAYRFQAN